MTRSDEEGPRRRWSCRTRSAKVDATKESGGCYTLRVLHSWAMVGCLLYGRLLSQDTQLFTTTIPPYRTVAVKAILDLTWTCVLLLSA